MLSAGKHLTEPVSHLRSAEPAGVAMAWLEQAEKRHAHG
jgi:hypothetical protein